MFSSFVNDPGESKISQYSHEIMILTRRLVKKRCGFFQPKFEVLSNEIVDKGSRQSPSFCIFSRLLTERGFLSCERSPEIASELFQGLIGCF